MATGRVPVGGSSPLTAKGDLYTYSTTQARLAVGNNGETLVADSSTSTGLRYVTPPASLSNPFINGNMEIAQRGTSAVTLSAGSFLYPVDRWFASRGSGSSGATAQQVSSISLTNFNNAVEIKRNSGDTSTAELYLGQSFETKTSLPFAGKTVTLSFWAKAGANYSATSSNLGFRLYSGTGTDQSGYGFNFTGTAQPLTGNQVITTSWVRYAVTGTISSSATQLQVLFIHAPTGTAGADDSVRITGVQLDVGTYASGSLPPFRLSANTLAGELAACQRYYFRNSATGVYSVFSPSNPAQSTTAVDFAAFFPVTMRIAPTSIEYSNVAVTDNSSLYSTGTFALQSAGTSTSAATIRYTHGTAALTQFRPYFAASNNSASGYLAFNAEL